MQTGLTTTHPAIIFGNITEALSAKWLASNLKYSLTHIYRMGADPQTNGEARRSPIHMIEIIITELVNRGRKELAVKIVDRLCRLLGGRFVSVETVKADKITLAEELLDNVSALAAYTKTMQDPSATIDEKAEAKRRLLEDIEQDWSFIK